MPPKGWPSAPKAGAARIVLCLLFSHFAASQPLSEVVVPGINPFYAAPPRKKPGPPRSLPFQADGAEDESPLSRASELPEAAPPAPEQQTLPCACTSTGMSGTVNTSTVGCGQWLLAEGSNVFMCYIAVSRFLSFLNFDENTKSTRFLTKFAHTLFPIPLLRILSGAMRLEISPGVSDFQVPTSKCALPNAQHSKEICLL